MTRPVLLLDIMSTVVYDPIHHEIPDFFSMSLAEFFRAAKPQSWIDFELGKIDEVECMANFFLDGRSFDADAFRDCVRDAYAFIDDRMESLLSQLSDLRLPMHALSNYPIWYQMIEERLELSRFLSWTFVSCHMGVRKPDPEIYHLVADELQVEPAHTLVIEDSPSGIRAAISAGMRVIAVTTPFTNGHVQALRLLDEAFIVEDRAHLFDVVREVLPNI